jgi:ketosteroid isomerase-like protein
MTRRVPLILACAALLAGCGGGGGGDEQSARDAAQAYVNARNQGDAAKVCELYSDQLKSRLRTSNCEDFVKEQTSGVATSYTLLGVQESGDTATATIHLTAGGEIGTAAGKLQIKLERQNGEWRITNAPGGGGD